MKIVIESVQDKQASRDDNQAGSYTNLSSSDRSSPDISAFKIPPTQ